MACHLGVLTDLPCVGVAKKLLQVDGLENDAQHREKVRAAATPAHGEDRERACGATQGPAA